MKNDLILTGLNIYPVKSLGGISLHSSKVEKRGLQYDRRWMLVDSNNIFLTQRQHPEMALLRVSISDDGLIITHKIKNLGEITVPFIPEGEKIEVAVWSNLCIALSFRKNINEWLSDALGINCSIVYMPESTQRPVNPKYAANEIVSFADGYPFLIIGEESLSLLNSKLSVELPMNRFRPNFVFSGGFPHCEDEWKRFQIGNVIFHGVKPSDRCVVTTVNQDTAEKGKEPLATLATYRKFNHEVLFGQNLISESDGDVKVGDKIILIERK
jgi:uncharacterized protein YcbX